MFDVLQKAACPACGAELKFTELLDHCGASWPEQRLLYFKCPRCLETRHVKVRDDRVAVGYLDGAPGPRFVTQKEIVHPGLTVSVKDAGIEVATDDRVWYIAAKR